LKDFHVVEAPQERIANLVAGAVPNAEAPLSSFTDPEIAALADRLAKEADEQQTDYGAVLYVFAQILHTRQRNIEQLDTSLGVSAARPAIVRLYAPALVDYDCWYVLSEPMPSLSIDLQAQVMAELAKMQSDPSRFVNGYVAFDPLRTVLVDAGLVTGRPPLEIVRDAVENRGFLGVKLYPPMGFKPIGNPDDPAKYSKTVQRWVERLAARYSHPREYEFGAKLDDALDRLFVYCRTKDIPIMAHCGDSQASFAGAGADATPENWETLLTRQDRDFRALRLNLAHFGGFWCKERAHTANSDPYSEDTRCAMSADWTERIIRMVMQRDGGGWRFPNLYFDVADLGDISVHPEALKTLHDVLAGYADEERQAIASRILYGTDWFFLALAGKEHVHYVNDVQAMLDTLVPAERAFHANAAEFLGLTASGMTARRLRGFYADNQQRLEVLETIFV
jgi:predicted TIM-barrel fold metal-dependent hydrolase